MFTSTMESRQGCPYRLLAAMDYTTGPTPLHGNTLEDNCEQLSYNFSVAVSGACGKICFCQVDG
jgi:hypothetical protein